MSTIIAFDFGVKRIGVAYSDIERVMSFPYLSINYVSQAIDIIKKYRSTIVVIGWPGGEYGYCVSYKVLKDKVVYDQLTNIKKNIMNFVQYIISNIDVEIYLLDESFSSIEAVEYIYQERNYFLKGQDSKSQKFKNTKDKISAYIILKYFLEYIELHQIS